MSSARDGASSKALALIAGALVLGAVHFAVIAPLFSYYEATAQKLKERQVLVQRHQNAVRNLPRLRAVAEQARRQPPNGDLLLTGSTDAVDAAELQSTLKVLVELEGAKLDSAEMLPPDTEESVLRRVGVRVAFTGNLTLLTTVLEGVEATRPVLSVGNLDVHMAADPDEKDDDRTLAIVMDVYGFHSQ